MQLFIKHNEIENNKESHKQESPFILLRSLHFILKPTIRGEDIDYYSRIVNTCFSQDLIKKYDKWLEDTDGGKRQAIKQELVKEGIFKSVDLENKCIEVENYLQVRQGVVLVGDTFTGKSKTIKTVRNLLNKKLLPLFEEF
jgi:hypothetical protein